MTGEDAVVRVIDALDALTIPYMLVGSYSYNFFGLARATADADFVLEVTGPFVTALGERLRPDLQIDPQMQFETVTGTYKNVIDIAGSEFKIELFQLSEDDHDRERFRRRMRLSWEGRSVFTATAEDVIVMKLRWCARAARTKDRLDVGHVLAVQGDALDFDYIHSWCDKHGTRVLLDEIRAGLPRI